MADAGRRVHRGRSDVPAHPAGYPQVELLGEHQSRGALLGSTGQAHQLRDCRVCLSAGSCERGGGRLRCQEGAGPLRDENRQTGRFLRSRTGREEGIGVRRRKRREKPESGHRLRTHDELDLRGDTGCLTQLY